VLVTPGPSFAVDGTFEHHVRMPFTLPPEVLERAVDTLAQTAGRLGPGTLSPPPALETAGAI
jgi:bifunctional pyridoxal-dependent enzyme with beta-cystathionase and maltose regulon repressor activities